MTDIKLYKYLTEQEHVESFLSGNMQFSSLINYILTEDTTRKDISEGYNDFDFSDNRIKNFIFLANKASTPKGISYLENITPLRNPENFFVLCLSRSDDIFNDFKSKYRVKINKVEEFSNRLNIKVKKFLNCDNRLSESPVEYYNKDSREKYGFINGATPIYKNQKYINENEYRYYFYHTSPYKEMKTTNGECVINTLFTQFKFNIGDIRDICEVNES